MFKQTVLAAVALTMLAVPMAEAQQRHNAPQQSYDRGYDRNNNRGPAYQQPKKPNYHAPKRNHYQQPNQNRWSKGHKVQDWRKRPPVRDYHRYGLQRPGRGQEWVKVDNNYLLISLATGIIASVAAGR